MIENNKIEFTDGIMYYKGIKLDISREIIQELRNNHWGKKMFNIQSIFSDLLKKKTGIVINEFGEKQEEGQDNNSMKTITDITDPNDLMLNRNQDLSQKVKQPKKEYTPINSYRPSGNLVYDNEMLNKIEDKFT